MAPKRINVHQLIAVAWSAGNVRLSKMHGTQRSRERLIGITEIRDVILYGER